MGVKTNYRSEIEKKDNLLNYELQQIPWNGNGLK